MKKCETNIYEGDKNGIVGDKKEGRQKATKRHKTEGRQRATKRRHKTEGRQKATKRATNYVVTMHFINAVNEWHL
jgi:hypothetical protein